MADYPRLLKLQDKKCDERNQSTGYTINNVVRERVSQTVANTNVTHAAIQLTLSYIAYTMQPRCWHWYSQASTVFRARASGQRKSKVSREAAPVNATNVTVCKAAIYR